VAGKHCIPREWSCLTSLVLLQGGNAWRPAQLGIDAESRTYTNWLRYVNCPRCEWIESSLELLDKPAFSPGWTKHGRSTFSRQDLLLHFSADWSRLWTYGYVYGTSPMTFYDACLMLILQSGMARNTEWHWASLIPIRPPTRWHPKTPTCRTNRIAGSTNAFCWRTMTIKTISWEKPIQTWTG